MKNLIIILGTTTLLFTSYTAGRITAEVDYDKGYADGLEYVNQRFEKHWDSLHTVNEVEWFINHSEIPAP